MEVIKTKTFRRLYDTTPRPLQRRFEKQAGFLLTNPRHPSLRTKKVYSEKLKRWVWQARVNGGWRFHFDIMGDTLYLLTIHPHPK